MSNFSFPLTTLVHENLSIVMDFCFSRKPIDQLVTTKFLGEWKYLRKVLFSMSEQRAGKAALELAMFMRLLDDREDISGYLNQTDTWSFGRLIIENKPDKVLKMRDVANKIIHSATLEWDLSKEGNPILVCISQKKDKWLRAEVEVVALAGFCGGLMS
jgi:hypothetical protein